MTSMFKKMEVCHLNIKNMKDGLNLLDKEDYHTNWEDDLCFLKSENKPKFYPLINSYISSA